MKGGGSPAGIMANSEKIQNIHVQNHKKQEERI
jgi:hypothetical protein